MAERADEQNQLEELLAAGRQRVMLYDVTPRVDDGRFPVKTVVDEPIRISCDLVADGHDAVTGVLRIRGPGGDWSETTLFFDQNDRYYADFTPDEIGLWSYQIDAWVDDFETWRHALERKHAAGQELTVELADGALLVQEAARRAVGDNQQRLQEWARRLHTGPEAERIDNALSGELRQLMQNCPNRMFSSKSKCFELVVDPELARFSAWYELFPRSFGQHGKHGTFADVERLLPYVASMGFDVLYLPPVHPIGRTFRKGPNNTAAAGPGDPGSPWAIGAESGGHKEIHPELGTESDFACLVAKARELGVALALDVAFQASPDHPYVRSNPEWFQHRSDGSIQYAENPPKKYQDVYPFDLSGPSWKSLWQELESVFYAWIDRGVRIFRVDNPHTKPIRFWEYCIGNIKRRYPDVVFLSEAFTRPKLMYALAKVGFTQSYTYFTWRTTQREIRQYLEELTRSEVAHFFRPNFWPNTPDILPEHLQYGGRPMFVSRMILAGTLTANWGIYGPSFELMEHVARPGSGDYLDSEKFQIRSWDLERSDSLAPLIARLNTVRRENPALQRNDTLTFHDSDNDYLMAYSKRSRDGENVILSVVNLEPYHRHSGWLTLDLDALGIAPDESYQVHDLVSDARFQWQSQRVYVELDPAMPAHVFRVRRRVRMERSFEYYV